MGGGRRDSGEWGHEGSQTCGGKAVASRQQRVT